MDRQDRYDALLAAIPLPIVVGGALAAGYSGSSAVIGLAAALLATALVGVSLFARAPTRSSAR